VGPQEGNEGREKKRKEGALGQRREGGWTSDTHNF